MHRIYILSSEVEVVENALGLSIRNLYDKPGKTLLLVLLVTLSSCQVRLRIYSELNTLLLDISPNTSAKVIVACPQVLDKAQSVDSELNGAEWLAQYLEKSVPVLNESQAMERIQDWRYVSYPTWNFLLKQGLSNTVGVDLLFYPYVALPTWNEVSKSVAEHYRHLSTRAVLSACWTIWNRTPAYCKDTLKYT